MIEVIAYNRYSLGGIQRFYFRGEDAEQKARDKRVDLLVRLPEDYVVEIKHSNN